MSPQIILKIFIHKNPELNSIRDELEQEVYNYSSSMELPDEPTIYDHLVLSLRNKDSIATFNWGPFLVQTIQRNGTRFKIPRVQFLHSNVEDGHCPDGHMMGNNSDYCYQCNKILVATKLLYPSSG